VSLLGFAALWGMIVGLPTGAEVMLPRLGLLRRPPHLSDRDIAGHIRWGRRIDFLLVPLTFPVGVAAGVGVWFACWEARLRTLVGAPNAVIFPPFEDFYGYILWGTPAVVLGVVAWGVAHAAALRLFLDAKQLDRYKGAVLLRHGYNQLLLGRLTVAWMVPLTLIAVVLTLDCYLRVEPDKLVVNEFLGFGEKVYADSDILAVVETTHVYEHSYRRFRGLSEKERESPRLWVIFKDGTEWIVHKPDWIDWMKGELERRTGRATFRRRHIQDLPLDQLRH
jgi:hypothetical protein